MTIALSVVIPVYNEVDRLRPTVDALVAALTEAAVDGEIVVVDDGSTDGTATAAVEAVRGRVPMRVVSQPNRGRYHAVRRGIEEATADYVLIIGARVRLRPGSLAFVQDQVDAGRRVWTGHVHVHTRGNLFGTFQNVLTEIAWKDYFDDPRMISFGLDEFDRFPKGSGCFVGPRTLVLEAFNEFRTRYRDLRHANDDTPILRAMAAREPISISPQFAADYASRASLRAFLSHSLHRGTVFLDGHGRRESRFFPFVVAAFPTSTAVIATSLRRPRVLFASLAATSAGAGILASRAGRSRHEIASAVVVAPLWTVAFVAGLWRGLWLLMSARFSGVGGRH